MGLGATHQSLNGYSNSGDSIFGSTRQSLGFHIIEDPATPNVFSDNVVNKSNYSGGGSTPNNGIHNALSNEPMSKQSMSMNVNRMNTVQVPPMNSGRHDQPKAIKTEQLVGKAWANRPDTAGVRVAIKPTPATDEPKDLSYFRNIDIETVLPIPPPKYLINAPRAIDISFPPKVQWGYGTGPKSVHPDKILYGVASGPEPLPVHPPIPPIQASVFSKDLVTPGPQIPIQLRLANHAPEGSGYIRSAPRDLKWNITYLEETGHLSHEPSEMWESFVMPDIPKLKPKPWEGVRGPWSEFIDITKESQEESFAKFHTIVRSRAVSKLQKMWRQRVMRVKARILRYHLKRNQASVKIQGRVRVNKARKVASIQRATRMLQRLIRGHRARKLANLKRRARDHINLIHDTITIQKYFRRFRARKIQKKMFIVKSNAALTIQKMIRGRFGRRQWRALLNQRFLLAMFTQARVRRFIASRRVYHKSFKN